jgi:hypothetical protein
LDRAVRAVSSVPRSLVAVTRDGRVDCAIEATFADRGGTRQLDALSVRAKTPLANPERGPVIAMHALEHFGGSAYVAIGAARGASPGAFEATICFPDVIPWLAENTVALPRMLAIDDLRRYSELLALLGVPHHVSGRRIDVRRLQLRLKPSFATLLAAYQAGLSLGFRTSLYAAAVPVTRSVRIEQLVGPERNSLDIALSRGLSKKPCTRADVERMDDFLRQWTGFGFSSLAWRVRASGTVAPKPAAARAPELEQTHARKSGTRPLLRVIEGGRSAGV